MSKDRRYLAGIRSEYLRNTRKYRGISI